MPYTPTIQDASPHALTQSRTVIPPAKRGRLAGQKAIVVAFNVPIAAHGNRLLKAIQQDPSLKAYAGASEEQEAVWRAVLEGSGHVIVDSVAGSGKSWTVFGVVARLVKLGVGVEVRTYHSLGLDTIKANTTRRVDVVKPAYIRGLVEKASQDQAAPAQVRGMDYGERRKAVGYAVKILGMCKSGLIDVRSGEGFELLMKTAREKGLDTSAKEWHIGVYLASSVLHEQVEDAGRGDGALKVVYDDMCWLPMQMGWAVPRFDFVFVDELQDTSLDQQALALAAVGIGSKRGRLIGVGDQHQCHPAGVRVAITGAGHKNIEDVKVGDLVVTYSSKNSNFRGTVSQGRYVESVNKRHYEGPMLTVHAGIHSVQVTPNHRVLARIDRKRTDYCVYLMVRGEHARIGIAKTSYRSGFGPAMRARQEKADAVWVLAVCDDEFQARIMEAAISANFGIPDVLFNCRGSNFPTQRFLDLVYRFIHPNLDRAVDCLNAYGRSWDFPLWKRGKQEWEDANSRHIGGYSFVMEACNLLPGLMSVKLFEGSARSGRWSSISDITIDENWKGYVYGIQVQPTEGGRRLYIANDIVVHNSIYAFRGAATGAMARMSAALRVDGQRKVEELRLSVTRRCPKSAVGLAKVIVPWIEALPDAIEGKIRVTTEGRAVQEIAAKLRKKEYGEGSSRQVMVICRINADLIGFAYELIKAGVVASVMGREIGEGLVELVEKLTGATQDQFADSVEDWYDQSAAKARKLKDKEERDERLAKLYDKYLCIVALAETVVHVDDEEANAPMGGWQGARGGSGFKDAVLNRLNELFSDETSNRVVCGTIHRCVHPDTLVETPDGLVPISALNPNKGLIATPDGMSDYIGKYIKPASRTLKLTTKRGYEIEVSPDHGLTAWMDDHHYRIEAADLGIGAWLRLRLGHTHDVIQIPLTPAPLRDISLDVRAVCYAVPERLSDELAELLGLLVADGTLYKSGLRVVKRYRSVIDRFRYLVKHLFGYEAKDGETHPGKGGMETPCATVNSVLLSRWLLKFGGLHPGKKDVPDIILRAPLGMQRCFLRGLFEDGTVNRRDNLIDHIHWDNRSPVCARKVQTMLLRLGIASTRKVRKDITTLYIYSDFAQKFANDIGFIATEKNEILRTGTFRPDTGLLIPLSNDEARALAPLLQAISKSTYDNALGRGYLSRASAFRCLNSGLAGPKTEEFLRERLSWVYQPIAAIEEGESETICVSVPNGNRFLQNGFDGWNTKGLEARTVYILRPDILGWSKQAKTGEDKQQERNLAYIAVTRWLEEGVFVEANGVGVPEVFEQGLKAKA